MASPGKHSYKASVIPSSLLQYHIVVMLILRIIVLHLVFCLIVSSIRLQIFQRQKPWCRTYTNHLYDLGHILGLSFFTDDLEGFSEINFFFIMYEKFHADTNIFQERSISVWKCLFNLIWSNNILNIFLSYILIF